MHLNIPGDVMLSYEAAVERLVGGLAGRKVKASLSLDRFGMIVDEELGS